MGRPKTLFDDELLKHYYREGRSLSWMGSQIGANRHTIRKRLIELGLAPPSRPSSLEWDDDQLRRWVSEKRSCTWMSQQMGRCHRVVVDRLHLLGLTDALRAGHPEHPIDEDQLRRHVNEGKSLAWMADCFGTTQATVLRRMRKLGLSGNPRLGYEWDDSELRRLAEQGLSCSDIARLLANGAGHDAVRLRLKSLGIARTGNSHRRKGAKSNHWKGGKIERNGYVKLLLPDHPMADTLGYYPEHRYVIEQHLGRYLLPCEVVHHRNEQKGDNRLENLQLMYDHQHKSLHATARHQHRRASQRTASTDASSPTP